MKKILLIVAILFLSSNLSFCDEKDSVQKYMGTSYYGEILKVYNYLPKPIHKRLFVSFNNNFLPGNSFYLYNSDNNFKNFPLYEIGFTVLYRIPSWHDSKLFGWNSGAIGIYYKNTIGYKYLSTIGIALKAIFDSSPITYLENIGIIIGDEKTNIEIEFGLGYDLNFSNWIISPKIMFNLSDMGGDINNNSSEYYNSGTKPLVYFGVNIGKFF